MSSKNRSSILFGLLIVLFGGILLLNNFGMNIDLGEIIATYWPILLIIWGINNIIANSNKPGSKGNIIFSSIILFFGLLILGKNLGYYYFNLSIFWKILWPLVLIFIGFNILRGASKTNSTGWAVMSGIEQKNEGWQLKDKSYIAFMGGIELDLSAADIPDGETYLDLTAVMGGIDIKATEDINISCNGTGLLGGIEFLDEDTGGIIFNRQFEHKSDSTDSTDKKVIINCRAVMGGVTIKM